MYRQPDKPVRPRYHILMSTQKQFAKPHPAIIMAADLFKIEPKPEHAGRVLNRRKLGKEPPKVEARGIALTAEEVTVLRSVASARLRQLVATSSNPEADPEALALGRALIKLAGVDRRFYGGK